MIELKAGLAFKSKTFIMQAEIVKIDEAANKMQVKLTSSEDHAWAEDWDLQHTRWAFDNGTYFIPKPPQPDEVTVW